MKKTFKYLIIFVVLLLVGVRVEASELPDVVWHSLYEPYNDYGVYYDVDNSDGGLISVGEVEYTTYVDNVATSIQKGTIDLYDKNANFIDSIQMTNWTFYKVISISDGFLVLGDYSDNEVKKLSLLKFSFDGNLVWEKELSSKGSNGIMPMLISLESYNDIVVVSCLDFVYIFNGDGELIKSLFDSENNQLLLPLVKMDNDAIYILGLDLNSNTVLEKYSYDNYQKVSTHIIYSSTVVDDNVEDFSIGFGFEIVNDSLIIETLNVNTGFTLYNYDKNLNLVEESVTDIFASKIVNYKNNILLVGQKIEVSNDAKGILLETNLSDIILDIKGNANNFVIKELDMDFEENWVISYLDYTPSNVEVLNDGFVVSGYDDDVLLVKYAVSNIQKGENFSFDDGAYEKFYNGVDLKDGFVAIGYGEGYKTTDPKLALAPQYGLIVKYDENDEMVWYKYSDVKFTNYINAVAVSDGIVVASFQYDSEFVSLVKYDFDGNLKWNKTILENVYIYDEMNLAIDSYNDKIIVAYEDYVAIYNGDDGNLDHIIMEDDLEWTYAIMNENGIYVSGYKGDFVIYQYNYDYELVNSMNGINSIGDEKDAKTAAPDPIYLSSFSDGLVGIVNNYLLYFNSSLEFKDYTLIDENYFYRIANGDRGIGIITYDGCAPRGSADAKSCFTDVYFTVINNDFVKIFHDSLDSSTYDIVNFENGFKLLGAVYDDDANGSITNYNYLKFNINVSNDGNGTVTSSQIETSSGTEVEFTVEPKEGYVLKRVVVTTSSGEVIEFSDYKFTMPSEDVEIYAEFELVPNNPNTGLSNPLLILSIIVSAAVVGYLVIKKKKFI